MATQYTAGITQGQVWTAAIANQIGAASESYTPTVSNLPTSAVVGRYIRIQNLITVYASATASGAATGTISISLPTSTDANIRNSWNAVTGVALAYDLSANAWQFGVIQPGTSSVAFSFLPTPAFYAAAVPFVWANGDVLTFSITYLGA
jgi:hypothetical protein